jgi:hypothetical protein
MSGRPAYLLIDEVIFDDLSVIVTTKKKSEFKCRLRYARGLRAIERYQFATDAFDYL